MFSPKRWLLATWPPISTTIVSLHSDLIFVNSAVQHSLMHPGWKNFQTFTSLKNSNQTHRSLKRHALLHGGVRPFSCATCNKGFYQRVGWLVHDELDPFNFLKMMQLSPPSQVAWLTHMKSHTSDRLPCPACAKPFLTRYLLNQVPQWVVFIFLL